MYNGKLTVVGAGPGDVDLITLKGIKALQNADVVLYDALVDTALLDYASKAEHIFVGKRKGCYAYQQDQINELIVQRANSNRHVVRLKGGDPFVFGRANEEIDYVESYGIPVSVVPGISSALAVPSNQGIPMTQRGISSSFWVMTATKRDGSFSDDLTYASQSSTTMVILMGVRKLTEIVQEVNKYRSSETPVAIIQNGTMKNESCMVSTLGGIQNLISELDTSKPGIIVIGNVVAEHPSFFEEEVQRVIGSNF